MDYFLQNKGDGISENEKGELNRQYKNTFPLSYLDFLQYTNGYLFDASSTLFYSSNEIVERNKTFEVDKYLPDYIAIGDQDGDKLILMKKNQTAKQVFIADSFSISMDNFKFCKQFDDLSLFIASCKKNSVEQDDVDNEALYDVILNSPISDKKLILALKNVFSYTGTIGTLMISCQNPPFAIKSSINYGLAKKLINQNPMLSDYLIMKKVTK